MSEFYKKKSQIAMHCDYSHEFPLFLTEGQLFRHMMSNET